MAAGVKSYERSLLTSDNKHQEAKSLTEDESTGERVRAIKAASARRVVGGAGEHFSSETGADGYIGLKTDSRRQLQDPAGGTAQSKPEIPKGVRCGRGWPRQDYTQPELDAMKRYVEGRRRALSMLGADSSARGSG